jgi:hypothetical protein
MIMFVDMQILGPYWRWQAFAMIMFAAVMAFLHWLYTGINADFGTGAFVGLIIGLVIGVVGAAPSKERSGPSVHG